MEGVFQVELPHYVMTARQNVSNVGADIEKQTSLLLQTVSASRFLVGYGPKVPGGKMGHFLAPLFHLRLL